MIEQRSLPGATVTVSDPDTSDRPMAPAVRPADRFMLRLLRISATDQQAASGAHRAFRASVLLTALRCFVMYVALPLLAPAVSFAGIVAAPAGIALCLLALVNGVYSIRRYWLADHPTKWKFTGFMAAVFAVLFVSLAVDITALGVLA